MNTNYFKEIARYYQQGGRPSSRVMMDDMPEEGTDMYYEMLYGEPIDLTPVEEKPARKNKKRTSSEEMLPKEMFEQYLQDELKVPIGSKKYRPGNVDVYRWGTQVFRRDYTPEDVVNLGADLQEKTPEQIQKKYSAPIGLIVEFYNEFMDEVENRTLESMPILPTRDLLSQVQMQKSGGRIYQQGGMPQDGMDEALMQAASASAPVMPTEQPEFDLQAMLDDPNSGVKQVVTNQDGRDRVLIVDENENILGERTVVELQGVPMDVLISNEGEVLYVFGEAASAPPAMRNGGRIKRNYFKDISKHIK